MSAPKAKPSLEHIDAKFDRCEGVDDAGRTCGGTALVCRMLGRDTLKPCCPNCTHENGWKPDQ